MANPQTTETQVYELLGSAQIEVSTDGITYVDVGAVLEGTTITEETTYSNLENENAQDRDAITNQTAAIEMNRLEIYNDFVEDIIRGSIDTTTNVAAAPVAGATQVYAIGDWGYNDFVVIENQMGDGTTPTINSLTGSTDGALVEDTDFFVGQNEAGIWGLTVIDSGTVTTESQTMTLDYDYTPNASTKRTTGGLSDVDLFFLRLTNVETIGGVERTVQYVFYKCNLASGSSLELKKYNAEDTRVSDPTTINAKQDTTRTKGDRLFSREITPPIVP